MIILLSTRLPSEPILWSCLEYGNIQLNTTGCETIYVNVYWYKGSSTQNSSQMLARSIRAKFCKKFISSISLLSESAGSDLVQTLLNPPEVLLQHQLNVVKYLSKSQKEQFFE